MSNKNITIITPTYNRLKEIRRLYESLTFQSKLSFIWHVYDDGSNDGTFEFINSLKAKAKFEISYFLSENIGKHKIINRFVENVITELLIIVDSDDVLTENAIERIFNDWEDNKHMNVVGMTYLKANKNGEIIGDKFPNGYTLSSHSEMRIKHNIIGDKAEVWLTSKFIEFPFPEFQGETFFSEQYKYLKISGPSRLLFINYVIYVCEYLKEGLSSNSKLLQYKNPNGVVRNAIILNQTNFPIRTRIKAFLKIVAYGLRTEENVFSLIKEAQYNFLWIIVLFPISIIYAFWLYIRFNLKVWSSK